MASISQIVKKYVLAPFGNLNGSLVNDIPLNASNNPNGATWNYGFPQITMTPVDSGCKPPSGKDFNGILYVLSNSIYNHQLGIAPNEWISGYSYPKGAIVEYPTGDSINKSRYISLLNNNETTPTSGNWKKIGETTLTIYPDEQVINGNKYAWVREHADGFIEQGGMWATEINDINRVLEKIKLIRTYSVRHFNVSIVGVSASYTASGNSGAYEIGAIPVSCYGHDDQEVFKPLPLDGFYAQRFRMSGGRTDKITIQWKSCGI